ncbi:MAG: hypothetical protein PVG33_12950 [Chloroflexota bacterium]
MNVVTDIPIGSLSQPDFEALAARFRVPGVVALALMGSYVRG